MKIKAFLFVAALFFFIQSATSAYAGTFSDNFDDGDTDGWWLGYSIGQPTLYGNWRIEDGSLVQDTGMDGVVALLENFQIASQTVKTDLKLNGPSGGGGITIWFQNNNTLAFVVLSNGTLNVAEVDNGLWHSTNYPYPYSVNENRWVNLKVDANSITGDLDVYVDNVYVLTHQLTTTHRIGQTGVIHGNAGGYFDNFEVTSDSIIDYPTPTPIPTPTPTTIPTPIPTETPTPTETPVANYSFWSTEVPGNFDNNDTTSVELGVKFRSSVAGYVKGIRFYKSPLSTGTYTGTLWKTTGAKLASAKFTSVTSSGWQTVIFPTPVAIAANTTYVASYHLSSGRYAQDINYFSSNAYTNGYLTVLKNGTDGWNGVYRYSSTVAYPNNGYKSSNYWVDIIFSTP